MTDKLFDCARDKAQIAAGTHFYCETHMTAVLVAARSPDPRYCQQCYNLLLREVEHLPPGKRSAWIPKSASQESGHDAHVADETPAVAVTTDKGYPNQGSGNYVTEKRRGRPQKPDNEPVSRMTLWRRARRARQGVLAL